MSYKRACFTALQVIVPKWLRGLTRNQVRSRAQVQILPVTNFCCRPPSVVLSLLIDSDSSAVGLVVEFLLAMQEARVRFPDCAFFSVGQKRINDYMQQCSLRGRLV
jgi:hypothetical protein